MDSGLSAVADSAGEPLAWWLSGVALRRLAVVFACAHVLCVE